MFFRIRFSGTAFANVRKYAIEKTFSPVTLLEVTGILKDVVLDRIDLLDSHDPASFSGTVGTAPSKLFHTPTPLLGLSCCT